MSRISELEENLAFQIRAVGLPDPVREYHFAPGRRYRADFAWVNQKLLVELEGGLFSKGRGWHLSIGGYLDDLEKSNLANLLGFRLLRYTSKEVRSGRAIKEIEQALSGSTMAALQLVLEA